MQPAENNSTDLVANIDLIINDLQSLTVSETTITVKVRNLISTLYECEFPSENTRTRLINLVTHLKVKESFSMLVKEVMELAIPTLGLASDVKTSLLQNPKKIISQINTVINATKNGWVKERLSQISKFKSSESPLDSFYKEKCSKYTFIDNPEAYFNEKIKRFTEHFLEEVFLISTAPIYDAFDMSGKNLIVAGEVSPDGWGDYFQMWLSAKNLGESFPKSSLAVSADLCSRDAPPQISHFNREIKNLSFASSEEFKKIELDLTAADLIINLPHGSSPNPKKKPTLRVEENGFNCGENFALGLSPMSYHVLGIPLTSVSPANSLEELSHPFLRTVLAEKQRPFFLAYLKKDHGNQEIHRAGFVVAAAGAQARETNDFAIICPFDDIQTLPVEQLKSLGISEVILTGKDEKALWQEKQSLIIQPQGKKISLLDPFPLSNDDWMLLLKFCEPLVGCTGDMSFSEVISNKKIPFYQIRWHKKEFLEQLLEVSGYVYRDDFKKLYEFLILIKESLEENSKNCTISENCMTIGRMINSELIVEVQKFTDCIQRYYCTNELLASRVRRELAYAHSPTLKEKEEKLLGQWKNGTISLKQACEILQKEFDS